MIFNHSEGGSRGKQEPVFGRMAALNFCRPDVQTVSMSYSNIMDHLAVLRETIARLRVEIADLQELNEQYRRESRHETEAQVAHGRRHERLQAIQQELAQLADLGRRVRSVEQMKEEHRSRLQRVKNAS